MKQDNSDVKEALIEGILFVVGVFLYALCFNLFLIPNDLVVSGFSGVAIVAQKLFGWPASTFIYITNAILLVVSFIFLGWKLTKRNIAGSIMYPLMITVSEPIANFWDNYIIGDDFYRSDVAMISGGNIVYLPKSLKSNLEIKKYCDDCYNTICELIKDDGPCKTLIQ